MPRGVRKVTEQKQDISPEKAEAIKAANADWKPPVDPDPKVRLTIHRPKDEKSHDVFVSVNFKDYQIRFDSEVEVPKSVVDALKATQVTTMVQDPHTEKMIPVKQARFAMSVEPI